MELAKNKQNLSQWIQAKEIPKSKR